VGKVMRSLGKGARRAGKKMQSRGKAVILSARLHRVGRAALTNARDR